MLEGGAPSHHLRGGSAAFRRAKRHATEAARVPLLLAFRLAIVGLSALAPLPVLQAQTVPGNAAEPTATAAADPLAADQIAARRAAVAKEIAETTAAASAAAAVLDSEENSALELELRTLRTIDGWLTQQQELVAERANPSTAVDNGKEAAEKAAPISIFSLDELHNRRLAAEQAIVALEDRQSAQRDALADAKERLEKAETKRRTARQELEAAQAPVEKDAAARQLRLRKLKSRDATERLRLRTLEAQLNQAELEEKRPAPAALAAGIEKMHAALAAQTDASVAGYSDLTRIEAELQRERENLDRDLATAELRLEAVQRRFSRTENPPVALVEELELLTTQRDAKRREIAMSAEKLERLEIRRSLFRHWEEALGQETSREQLAAAREAVEPILVQLGEAELQKQGRLDGLHQRIDRLSTRAKELGASPHVTDLIDRQIATLSQLVDLQNRDQAALLNDRRLAERVLADIDRRSGAFDFYGYVRLAAGGIRDVWQYELTAVDDEPITIASLVVALFLVVVGLMLSRRIANLVGRISVDRFKVDGGAAAALETLAFYVLLASFTLFALRMVNFPLTAFTVLGGALAIGIGFGSQNVMNNFISGLILMLERPVRAQDVVEVDGTAGTVEKIGARSTQIRSSDGRHIIVPNSYFLESNVVNWTLSDDLIRTTVAVGVTYGSPTRLVKKLISQAIEEDREILKHPEPAVIFAEFGDNALNFEVYFWIRARTPAQIRAVQSRIRFRIDDLFRESELVIAFPQRDIHLDTVSPIDIRVLRDGKTAKRE